MDAWVLLGYVAAKTSTIKLGTVVTPIPFRPPAQLAKIVATVDVLSGGRAILGVGAGWHQPEFDGFSRWEPAGVRVDQTTEALDLITRLWKGSPVDFQGTHYSASGAQIAPTPVQKPHPPLWFGTRGRRMLRLAARYADCWIPTNIEPDEYRRGMERLRTLRAEMGISGDLKGSLQHFTAFEDADEFLSTIRDYADAGCTNYGSVWSYPPDEMVSRIRWFAREVMPNAPS
jgi:alkanesulfonate monooxygenase SsuD/methylene tetrahydromethanopterin reductase-like flavin-dependent oxidoreductase (luciferase family)